MTDKQKDTEERENDVHAEDLAPEDEAADEVTGGLMAQQKATQTQTAWSTTKTTTTSPGSLG